MSNTYGSPRIVVHDVNYTVSAETILQGFDPVNDHAMLVDPPLPWAPSAGYIVEISDYPVLPDVDYLATYKVVHAFSGPSVTVVSGLSGTEFTVGALDIGKFTIGLPVLVRTTNYSSLSGDKKVTAIDTGTNKVTVATTLGFTPSAGMLVELIGMPDGKGAYRCL
jgi:hypothetical protein